MPALLRPRHACPFDDVAPTTAAMPFGCGYSRLHKRKCVGARVIRLFARAQLPIGRAVGLGTLLLFIGLGLAGAFVGTRPSFEIGTLLVKSLVCVALLAFIVPVSLDRDERRAFLSRLGTIFGND